MNVIPNTSHVDGVWFEPEFSAICSIGKRPFWGRMRIEYRPTDLLLEFVSVETFVHALANNSLTIEDLVRTVFDECVRVLGDIPLRVTCNARTTVHAPVGAQIKRGEW